jgi:hypothetical protein
MYSLVRKKVSITPQPGPEGYCVGPEEKLGEQLKGEEKKSLEDLRFYL